MGNRSRDFRRWPKYGELFQRLLTKPDNRLAIFEMSETPKPHRKETPENAPTVSKSALIKALCHKPCLNTYPTKNARPENGTNAESAETSYNPEKNAIFTKAWRTEKAFTLCIFTPFAGTTLAHGKSKIGKIAAQVLFHAERLKQKWNMTMLLMGHNARDKGLAKHEATNRRDLACNDMRSNQRSPSQSHLIERYTHTKEDVWTATSF